MATSTVEDYLKRIYLEQQRDADSRVATGTVAQALGVTPGTATAMVKTLADAGLAEHARYAGVRLTPQGERLAARVIRRHRLIELFLVRVLGMSWSEVHGEAEILEHAVSDDLLTRIDAMLGFPSVDPHGDPIPSADGTFAPDEGRRSLADVPLHEPFALARVLDQRPEFLDLLGRHGLVPGRALRVASRDPVADTIEVLPSGGTALRLGFRAATGVLVEPSLGD